MHLFGLNWQLQELNNQVAFENGGAGKTGPTQSSAVTALAADGERQTLTSELTTSLVSFARGSALLPTEVLLLLCLILKLVDLGTSSG